MQPTDDRTTFLHDRARLAMLSTLRSDGSPVTVPVWFEWDGHDVSMFCAAGSAKLSRIERDPRISVLVANDVDEPEYWVSFDGAARIDEHGGFELAERLAAHYWDLDDAGHAETLATWRSVKDVGFRKIVLTPTRIREYGSG
jgi:PPOX class probable F420-dependent enzyme